MSGIMDNSKDVPEHQSEGVCGLPREHHSSLLSEAAKTRKPDEIRSLIPLESRPNLISMLAGKPNTSTFPITSLQFTTRDPSSPSSEDLTVELSPADLEVALQYSATGGLPGLCEWAYGLQERVHGRKKGEGWRVAVGAGSQDLLNKAVSALVNPGDAVLIETPCYAGAIPIFANMNCEMIEVPTDSQGIRSRDLRSILENWPADKAKPKVLYTIPYGSNPTGVTASLERRLEVLELSQQHNFIILEDDPYYYLYYGEAPRVSSYFALEHTHSTPGRVLRFDSLSKILSSGMRIGFASGPDVFLDAMEVHTAIANLQPSSFSQVIALKVLEAWGYDRFLTHTERISEFYREKRDVFEGAMRRHLTGLAEWSTPVSGMFVWFKLLLGEVGSAESHDSASLIRTKALERGVLALPGTAFFPRGGKTAYVRASFSLLPPQDVDEGLRRLREVIVDARTANA